ncbi:MAG: ATP synthase F1 subunit delta, partial [Rickettsiales bacterium]
MSTSSADLRRIAARYVSALFALASEKKQLDAVKKDLDAVGAALNDSEDFRRLLSSPVMSRDEQAAGVEAVLTKMKATPLTRNFFRTLAENRRLDTTPWIVKRFDETLAESR